MLETLQDVLMCPYCRSTALEECGSQISCATCEAFFPVRHNIVNTLWKPSPDVLQEIRGGMHEAGMPSAPIEEYIFRKTESIQPFSDRLAQSESPSEWGYHRMTSMNVEHALKNLRLTGAETVLEIGGDRDFPFLDHFRKLGCRCFETNIYFYYSADGIDPTQDVAKVAGDMMSLPYRPGSFDIILLSAAVHHSPNLGETLQHLASLLRPGGTLLLLSEPVEGFVKSFWKFGRFSSKGRAEEIHENEIPIASYEAAVRTSGLQVVESFFSPFYERKLQSRDLKNVRFAPIARLAALAWRISAFRNFMHARGLRIGQAIFGLQLNLVLRKA